MKIFQNQLYLLQSRPVTTICTWHDFELTHEMDFPLLTEHSLFTVANVREVIPNGATVLAQTSSMRSLDRALQSFALENYDKCLSKGCPVFQHNLFIDVVNVSRYNYNYKNVLY